MTKAVELYVRSAEEPKRAYALGSTFLGGEDREYPRTDLLSCGICTRATVDLAPLRQPLGGWPDVVILICDHGLHRLDES
jgi:hypothetical protein